MHGRIAGATQQALRMAHSVSCHLQQPFFTLHNVLRMAAQARRFMPFLEGSRQCVGMSLARMTTAATVAALLSQFTFRLADSVRPSASPGTVLLQWEPPCHNKQ